MTKNSQVVWSIKVTRLSRCSTEISSIKTQKIHSSSLENFLKAKYEPQILQLHMHNIYFLTGWRKVNNGWSKDSQIWGHQVCNLEKHKKIWWNTSCSPNIRQQLWNESWTSIFIGCCLRCCWHWHWNIQNWPDSESPWSQMKTWESSDIHFRNYIKCEQPSKQICERWWKIWQSEQSKKLFQNCFKRSIWNHQSKHEPFFLRTGFHESGLSNERWSEKLWMNETTQKRLNMVGRESLWDGIFMTVLYLFQKVQQHSRGLCSR